MERLLEQISKMDKDSVTFESLGEFIYNYDFNTLDYKDLLPEISDPNDYGRNILTMDPIEVVLLRWPPGVQSAIHYHNGLFGYVVILDGIGQDVSYSWAADGILTDSKETYCYKNGIIREPDGIIHKIFNPQEDADLVTLHFYSPALVDFDGMEIYDLDKGNVGVLSKTAKTASWSDEPGHFNEIRESEFKYEAYVTRKQLSHRIVVVTPKPQPEAMQHMIADYYNEQAHQYDQMDEKVERRDKYTHIIDELIGKDLKASEPMKRMLVVASGTGRRTLKQTEMAEQNAVEITGVDISKEMAMRAEEKGINTINAPWLEADLPDGVTYSAATYLYAIGHLSTHEERLNALRKVCDHLEPGSPLYLDAFNLEEENEWGKDVVAYHENYQLQDTGYDEGDVFYRRANSKQVSFLHYFTELELRGLLSEAGFELADLHYVGYKTNPGELVDDSRQGMFFVKAVKAGA